MGRVISLGNIDDDNLLDVGWIEFGGNDANWNEGEPAVFSENAIIEPPNAPSGPFRSIHLANMDGTGVQDDVILGRTDALWFMTSTSSFPDTNAEWNTVVIANSGNQSHLSVVTGDMDRDDGSFDLDVISGGTAGIYWYEFESGSPVVSSNIHTVVSLAGFGSDEVDHIKVADVDGDGDLDVIGVGTTGAGSGRISWFENRDAGHSFIQHTIEDAITGTPTAVDVADLDNDGFLDLVVGFTGISGTGAIKTYTNLLNVNDEFSTTDSSNVVFSVANSNQITVADFEDDLLHITLTSSNGSTLSLGDPGAAGLSALEGDNSSYITFYGQQTAVNTAIEGLIFNTKASNADYIEYIVMSADDLHGGVDHQTVTISVTAVDDTPVANDDHFVINEHDNCGVLLGNVLSNDESIEEDTFVSNAGVIPPLLVAGKSRG